MFRRESIGFKEIILANNHQKLELTWIGKDNQPKLEPRILIEDPERTYRPFCPLLGKEGGTCLSLGITCWR